MLAQEPAAGAISLLDAVVLGLVEGLTEFLPISSTGHLIVANRLLGLQESPLTIGIQVGAITAILVLYWRDLLVALLRLVGRVSADGRVPGPDGRRTPNLWLQIVVAAVPAGVLGLAAGDWIEAHLFSPAFVAGAMVLGGVALLLAEPWAARRGRAFGLEQLGYGGAFCVGLWQCAALLPGTSRAAATILGGLFVGLSRTAAAELSFLVGLPILYGACALELVQHRDEVFGPLLQPFAVATVVAFVAALAVVRPFVGFLRTHTFAAFAVYRIVAGLLIAAACAARWL